MKRTLKKAEMVEALMNDPLATWSYSGAVALVERLLEIEKENNVDMEFSIDSYRKDYREYKDMRAVREDYPFIQSMEDLEAVTIVIEHSGGLLVNVF